MDQTVTITLTFQSHAPHGSFAQLAPHQPKDLSVAQRTGVHPLRDAVLLSVRTEKGEILECDLVFELEALCDVLDALHAEDSEIRSVCDCFCCRLCAFLPHHRHHSVQPRTAKAPESHSTDAQH